MPLPTDLVVKNGSNTLLSSSGAGSLDVVGFDSAVPSVMAAISHPDVTAMTRLYNNYSVTLMVGDRQFRQRIDSVDTNFFSVIKLPLVKGDPARVFAGWIEGVKRAAESA